MQLLFHFILFLFHSHTFLLFLSALLTLSPSSYCHSSSSGGSHYTEPSVKPLLYLELSRNHCMTLYSMFDMLSDQECFLTVCLIIVLTYSVAYFV